MIFSSNYCRLQKRFIVWLTVVAMMVIVAALVVVGRSGLGHGADRLGNTAAKSPDGNAVPLDPSGDRIAASDDSSSVVSSPAWQFDPDAAVFPAWELFERRVAESVGHARESVVTLEYTSAYAPSGTRRVATGVVINNRGDVVSVRIDPPPPEQASPLGGDMVPIVACDFSGRRHVAHWVAADPETGLTLLRLSSRAVPPIRMAVEGPNLGGQVFVVGNPFGMGHSVNRGHVAGLDRALEVGTNQLRGLIQIQASLYPGDSGAVVVNSRGDWLGVIRSGLAIPAPKAPEFGSSGSSPGSPSSDGLSSSTEADSHFGFAIPACDALWVANQLQTRGRVDRAYLGVRLVPISTDSLTTRSSSEPGEGPRPANIRTRVTPASKVSTVAEPSDLQGTAVEGAMLRQVLAGTPAGQAGLRPGDNIVALDGQPIRSVSDLTDLLDRIPAGTTIHLRVVRGQGSMRQWLSLSLLTASRPDPPRLTPIISPASPAARSQRSNTPLASTESLTASVASTALTSVSSSPRPDDLRITLPRALVERLDQLERRLEKLEGVSKQGPHPAPSLARQISSARKP